jgi:hypothetical protein
MIPRATRTYTHAAGVMGESAARPQTSLAKQLYDKHLTRHISSVLTSAKCRTPERQTTRCVPLQSNHSLLVTRASHSNFLLLHALQCCSVAVQSVLAADDSQRTTGARGEEWLNSTYLSRETTKA